MSFLISLIKIILFPIFAIVILEKSLNDNIVHSYFNSNNRDRWELLTIVWLNNLLFLDLYLFLFQTLQ
jgi:hypothetical protein